MSNRLPEYAVSLPIAALDGSLHKRLHGLIDWVPGSTSSSMTLRRKRGQAASP